MLRQNSIVSPYNRCPWLCVKHKKIWSPAYKVFAQIITFAHYRFLILRWIEIGIFRISQKLTENNLHLFLFWTIEIFWKRGCQMVWRKCRLSKCFVQGVMCAARIRAQSFWTLVFFMFLFETPWRLTDNFSPSAIISIGVSISYIFFQKNFCKTIAKVMLGNVFRKNGEKGFFAGTFWSSVK